MPDLELLIRTLQTELGLVQQFVQTLQNSPSSATAPAADSSSAATSLADLLSRSITTFQSQLNTRTQELEACRLEVQQMSAAREQIMVSPRFVRPVRLLFELAGLFIWLLCTCSPE